MKPRNALSEADQALIAAAVRDAETRTAGEIVVIVAHEIDGLDAAPLALAALLALVVPWPLHLFTMWPTAMVLLAQAAIFAVAALTLCAPALRPYLVPPGLAARATRRMAQALFLSRGIHLTERRTGVLLFVALSERRVELVADAGIDAAVPPGTWAEVVTEVSAAARTKALGEGVARAVARIGAILAEHVPPAPNDRNELPDGPVEL